MPDLVDIQLTLLVLGRPLYKEASDFAFQMIVMASVKLRTDLQKPSSFYQTAAWTTCITFDITTTCNFQSTRGFHVWRSAR